jgi:hypothetical protein
MNIFIQGVRVSEKSEPLDITILLLNARYYTPVSNQINGTDF